MTTPTRIRTTAALAGLLLMSAGCGGLENLGDLGDILGGTGAPGGTQQEQVEAEVQQVDSVRQQIQVRTQDGRTGSVQYDRNTQVIYQQQQYPVTALERGDRVRMDVRRDAQGDLYVSRIDVRESVQERTGRDATEPGQLERFEGQVRQIDYDRGVFEMETRYGGIVRVSLPFNASDSTVQYFERLRRGDSVRLEGTPIGTGRVELHRFL